MEMDPSTPRSNLGSLPMVMLSPLMIAPKSLGPITLVLLLLMDVLKV
jgi:hypothetical protein